ncbi:MAG: protein translocase subunit SecF, partial [Bacteroidetes bacterium]|nr:protein translocase subunit SecF [Bacteroidota bacterium]
MRLFETADYVFIPNRTKGYIFSAILLTAAILSLGLRGLELGIDFRGGMEFVLENTEQLST